MKYKNLRSIIRKICILGNSLLMLIFYTDLLTIYITDGAFPHIITAEVNYMFVVWVGVITSTLSFYYIVYEELKHIHK